MLVCLPLAAQRTIPIDNDKVRVVVVESAPGPKGSLHEHKMNRVMIYLDEGTQRLEHQDGRREDLRFGPGHVLWSPKGGFHTSQNTAAKPWRVVEIELKKDATAGRAPWTDLDPVKADPKHYKVELENEQVRVIRFRNEPHGKIPLHQHATDRVVVFLTAAWMKVTSPDGAVSELKKGAGEVAFSAPGTHREENASAEPIELLAVELK